MATASSQNTYEKLQWSRGRKEGRHLCLFLVASVSDLAFQVHCGKFKFQSVIQDGLASTASTSFFAFEILNFMEVYQHISVVTH